MAEDKLAAAASALDALVKEAPDLLTAQANLKRAEDAASAATKRRSDLAERRSGLSATIETQADRGIEERRDEIAGELESSVALEKRLALEVAALTQLRNVLDKTRSAAREAYFAPIQEELAPLLRILHDDAALSFDTETMLPDGLSRGSEAEDLDTLSGGTKEQIAILTRLAFARLFAKQGRQMPIILDDALVYSDDTRIVKMFTALNRVADDQQILVFSCRQLAFADLGGKRPSIAVTEQA
jgi:DNA repair exonuclease SbcCD ATPase subunit